MKDFISAVTSYILITLFFLGDIATFVYFTVDRWDSLNWVQRLISVPFDIAFATVWPITLPMYLLGWIS